MHDCFYTFIISSKLSNILSCFADALMILRFHIQIVTLQWECKLDKFPTQH